MHSEGEIPTDLAVSTQTSPLDNVDGSPARPKADKIGGRPAAKERK